MNDLPQALVNDRKKFIERMNVCADGDRPHLYEKVLDELIEWSQKQTEHIAHLPSEKDQGVVRFVLCGTKRVFWAAYPRKERKDAKLVALEDNVADISTEARDTIRSQFQAIRKDEKEGNESKPTISFRFLFWEKNRREILTHLDTALAAVVLDRES